jgi:hypothetical protein
MEKNKTGTYLKYAVGEIVLVVIGILIALQINNWNEARKLNQLEKTYLNRLVDETKKDILTFTNEIQRLEKNNEKIVNLSNVFKEESYSDSLLVRVTNEYMIYGTIYPVFNPSTSTFEDLSSTGNISVITNAGIRERIVGHYEDYQFVELNFQQDYDWATPIDAPLFTDTDALKFDTYNTSFLFPNTTMENLAKEIKRNKDIYLRNAALHYWMNKDCILQLKQIKDKTITLSNLLEKIIKT